MRLLLAEPDQYLPDTVAACLAENGYSVDSCSCGDTAWDHLTCLAYDAAVLDVHLPRVDGYELVRRTRRLDNTTPLLLLGADCGPGERIRGLNLGADDFINRPFALEELVARIRVQTRRRAGRATNIFTAADLVVDCNSRLVRRGETEIQLTAREFSMLECLISHKGTALTRSQIEGHVWSSGYEGGSNVVDVYISYLRRKIDGAFSTKLIYTVRGQGYMLRV